MKRSIIIICRLLCFCLFCLLCVTAKTENPCAEIQVPPTLNVRLNANNTPTVVHFNVSNLCGGDFDIRDLGLQVFTSAAEVLTHDHDPKCRIRPVSVGSQKPCGCTSTTQGSFQCYASEVFPRQAERFWQIKSRNLETKQVVFNVSYPTILKNFITHGQTQNGVTTVTKGTTLQFICSWDPGHPQKRFLIRGPQNNTLMESLDRPYSEMRLNQSVKCQSPNESGQYRCEMNGTDQFKALTVIAKCPLLFKDNVTIQERTVQRGSSVSFTFKASSYNTEIRVCYLTPPYGGKKNCKSDVTVTGSPPDISITVTLKDVTNDDDGDWTLSASNPQRGPATLKFRLRITEPVVNTGTSVKTTADPGGSSQNAAAISTPGGSEDQQPQKNGRLPLMIGAAVGSVVVLIVIIVLVVCIIKRRRSVPMRASPGGRPSGRGNGDVEIVNSMYVTSGNDGMIANDLYEGSGDMRSGVPTGHGGDLYESMDERERVTAPPRPKRAHEEGPMYVDQEEIQRNKARNKAKKAAQEQEEGQVYVDQEEIRKNKARNKAKAKKADKQPDAENQGDVYVDQAEIQRNKARNRQRKERENGAHAAPTPDDAEGLYSN